MSENEENPLQQATTTEENVLEEFINVNNSFVPAAYREILKTKQENLLVSPCSALAAFALVQSGSRGQTSEEIVEVLFGGKKLETPMKDLFPILSSTDSHIFHLANKLYVKEEFAIHDDFKQTANSVFGADSENIDFTERDEAAKTMNLWIREQTENKIENLVDSEKINDLTRAVLINAVYFKADWLEKFHSCFTVKLHFYKTADRVVDVDTMTNNSQQYFWYDECPELKAKFLELPFKNPDASMVVVLPKERQGLAILEEQIDKVFLPRKFTQQLVDVTIPKFRIDCTTDFKEILRNLGVNSMFTEEADLSGVAGVKGDLFVSEVIQKSFLDVSEDGVEAAAAVYALVPVHVCAVIGDIEEFYANHPFLFYIKIKGVIIFAGRVIDPTNGSGVAYVPQLVKTKSSRRNYFSQLFSCCRP